MNREWHCRKFFLFKIRILKKISLKNNPFSRDRGFTMWRHYHSWKFFSTLRVLEPPLKILFYLITFKFVSAATLSIKQIRFMGEICYHPIADYYEYTITPQPLQNDQEIKQQYYYHQYHINYTRTSFLRFLKTDPKIFWKNLYVVCEWTLSSVLLFSNRLYASWHQMF